MIKPMLFVMSFSTFFTALKYKHNIQFSPDFFNPHFHKTLCFYLDLGEKIIDKTAEEALKYPNLFKKLN